MRFIVNFTKNTETVPVYNQKFLNYYVHKCLGINNEYHDNHSDYNISMLIGGIYSKKTKSLDFPDGARIVVSSYDLNFLEKLMSGFDSNPDFFWGMKYNYADYISESVYNDVNHFYTISPILIKNSINKKTNFVTIENENFDSVITEKTMNKLIKINEKKNLNLDLSNFNIVSAKNNKGRLKFVKVKNFVNVASHTILSITANKEVTSLIYNLGLGDSTGSGFGCICNIENINKYKKPLTNI